MTGQIWTPFQSGGIPIGLALEEPEFAGLQLDDTAGFLHGPEPSEVAGQLSFRKLLDCKVRLRDPHQAQDDPGSSQSLQTPAARDGKEIQS